MWISIKPEIICDQFVGFVFNYEINESLVASNFLSAIHTSGIGTTGNGLGFMMFFSLSKCSGYYKWLYII